MLKLPHLVNDFVKQSRQIFFGWLRKVENRDLLVQLCGNLHYRRNKNDRFEAVLEMERDIFETTNDSDIVTREERMKVLEKKDRRFDMINHQLQGGQGLFGGRISALLRLDRCARWN